MRLLASLLLFVLFPLVLSAQDSESQAQDIFGSIMSPFCEARLLRDCPSSQATELKNKIRADLEKGKSKDQILEEFYKTFGDIYRAAPKNSGFGRAAWLAPMIFVLVGGAVIYFWARKNRNLDTDPVTKTNSPSISSDLEKRIEQELL